MRKVAKKGVAIRHGDLVAVAGSCRKWVALQVTRRDIRRGTDVERPGLYLFGGYWYAREAMGGVLKIQAYGKVDALQGRKVGRMRGHFAAMRHCR